MDQLSFEKQFIGQARLVRLLLWRIGNSTDIDTCLAVAKDAHMITEDDERFLWACMDSEERHRNQEASGRSFEIDQATITHLRRCADKLNRADSA